MDEKDEGRESSCSWHWLGQAEHVIGPCSRLSTPSISRMTVILVPVQSLGVYLPYLRELRTCRWWPTMQTHRYR